MQKIKWGILGTGRMAEIFTTELQYLPMASVQAVGSRDIHKANTFADRFKIPERFGSYENFVRDASVDVIYVATPHSFHKENTLLALEAGKHVLCEKPFAINFQEADVMIQTAHHKGLFLMDALWVHFTPLMQWLKMSVEEGYLGNLGMFSGAYGYAMAFDPSSRIFNPALGGGALLDVGIYPLSTSIRLLGIPEDVVALAKRGNTGIDERTGCVMKTGDGKISVFYTAVINQMPLDFTVMGEKGIITVPGPWWHQDRLIIKPVSGNPQEKTFPFEHRGYGYMAQHVMMCIQNGVTESPILPHSQTLSIMNTMDKIRQAIGLTYPMEEKMLP
ncbi:MAG: Gfo/Idh/MocA family oxidoreductase [Candidatus Marinimicrobia bacterium]|nr:Gfo/Idh/MocA family oxidoreductase [Candidatus Neomarinimicrobiota bacterium]